MWLDRPPYVSLVNRIWPKCLTWYISDAGTYCTTCCANYITETDHGDKFDEAMVESVLRSFYMNDLVQSVETKEFMRTGKFHLTTFQPIGKFVMDCLPT